MIKTQGTHKEDMLDCSLGREDNLALEEGNTGVTYTRKR